MYTMKKSRHANQVNLKLDQTIMPLTENVMHVVHRETDNKQIKEMKNQHASVSRALARAQSSDGKLQTSSQNHQKHSLPS